MSATHMIWCDDCYAPGDDSTRSATHAREAMRDAGAGWHYVGGLDYCPDCWPVRKAAAYEAARRSAHPESRGHGVVS